MSEKEKLSAVNRKLAEIAYMPGFPSTAKSLSAYTKAVASIVHNKTVQEIFGDRAVDCKLPADQNDLDWLFDKIVAEEERLPMPAKLRRWHGAYFPPADGIEALPED
jgi:hypothetical protein